MINLSCSLANSKYGQSGIECVFVLFDCRVSERLGGGRECARAVEHGQGTCGQSNKKKNKNTFNNPPGRTQVLRLCFFAVKGLKKGV